MIDQPDLEYATEYRQLLDLFYQMFVSLHGVQTDGRLADCVGVAKKLFLHASTVFYLCYGIKVPLKDENKTVQTIDISSMAVIVRSALETCLTLYDVFFLPKNDDEFEFEHALWTLKGIIIREDYPIQDKSLQNDYKKAQQDIAELRERLRKTVVFNHLKKGEQDNVLKGKWKKAFFMKATAAGFDEGFIKKVYAYYSGYTHADGLSCIQIMTTSAQDKIKFVKLHMTTMMVVLSKAIIGCGQKFPETMSVCARNSEAYSYAKILAQAGSTDVIKSSYPDDELPKD